MHVYGFMKLDIYYQEEYDEEKLKNILKYKVSKTLCTVGIILDSISVTSCACGAFSSSCPEYNRS